MEFRRGIRVVHSTQTMTLGPCSKALIQIDAGLLSGKLKSRIDIRRLRLTTAHSPQSGRFLFTFRLQIAARGSSTRS